MAFADLMTWIEWPACQMLFWSNAVNTVESFSTLHFTSDVRVNVTRNKLLVWWKQTAVKPLNV